MGWALTLETTTSRLTLPRWTAADVFSLQEKLEEAELHLSSAKGELLAFSMLPKTLTVNDDSGRLARVQDLYRTFDELFAAVAEAHKELSLLHQVKNMLDEDRVRFYCESSDTYYIKLPEEGLVEVSQSVFEQYNIG